MKKNSILILSLIVISSLLLTGCFSSKKEEKEEKIIQPTSVILNSYEEKGLEFSPATIIFENGESVVVTHVFNLTSEEKVYKTIKMSLYDENDKLVYEMSPYLGSIKPGGNTELSITSTKKLLNVKKVKYNLEG